MSTGLVLNTNIDSLIAQNSLTTSGNQLTTALQQLSSGLQINNAADNAAGYAIAQGMTSQINGLNTAINNANDGVSLTQTAQGALTEITNDLQTMRDLAVQSLNATNSAQDRADLNQQFQQLSADIQQVATTASFNGVKLLDGSFSGQTFQIGANVGDTITVSSVASMQTSALGQYTGVNQSNIAIQNAGSSANLTVTAGTGGSVVLDNVSNNAKDVAAALNASGLQGLTATANATSATGTAGSSVTTSSSGNTDTMTINGINITITNTGNISTNVANAISSINGVSANTGVTAAVNGSGGITLTASDGSNIAFAFSSSTTGNSNTSPASSVAADYGLGTVGATTASTVNVNYVAPTGTSGSLSFAGTGSALAGDSYAIAETGSAVSTLSVATVTSSNTTLTAVDQALQQVATTGAQLGAYQNRFQAAIGGLQTDATNLSAAKSSIVDTNYAQATSDLSKAQILQQASTAMVAQANTIPQQILTLLSKLP